MLSELSISNEILAQALLIVFSACIILSLISICFVLYLKSKWFSFIEKVLEDEHKFYSLNIFFSIMGSLHYATIFFSKFHARRYGLLEKRSLVPSHVQQLFILNFIIFMASIVLMLSGTLIAYLLEESI
ncbi:MAG: sulfoxide reductase heme-binding subunit YedZ [Oleiphilaceae bacterium]|jgi:sulfoxide reductase heme-binding subunit YedZ